MLVRIFLFIFLISFVSALDVELDCPDEVYVDEEFSCDVEVIDGETVYDLKIEVDSLRNSVLEILDDGDWKSSYYYLNGFIEDTEEVSLKFSDEGDYDFVVKLRDGSNRDDFEVGSIRVLDESEKKTEDDDEEEEEEERVRYVKEKVVVQKDEVEDKAPQVISFGGDVVEEVEEEEKEDEWDYVSKDGMVINWLPYIFSLFLIFFIAILLWDKTSR